MEGSAMRLSKNQATFVGCLAPVCWGLSVSIVRSVSESLGTGLGLAVVYDIAFVFVWLTFGMPRLSDFPLKFRILGIGSALATSLTFAFSLALAKDATQTMEVGMINYLWPTLTILFAVLFNGQKAKWWLAIGVLAAVYGICAVLSGSVAVNFARIWGHVLTNPVSYLLGLGAALFWAAYSNFSRAWAGGKNPTTLIFAGDMLMFNFFWLAGITPSRSFTFSAFWVAAGSAVILGAAYGLWTYGVQYGNMTVMAIMSYFTPVLSCLFASLLLGSDLNHGFWSGVAIVVAGSFICWLATSEGVFLRRRRL